jgi:hypothetical protein
MQSGPPITSPKAFPDSLHLAGNDMPSQLWQLHLLEQLRDQELDVPGLTLHPRSYEETLCGVGAQVRDCQP